MVLLLPWKPHRWQSTQVKLFNSQLNADAFCEKSFTTGLFWWSYANLFWGSGSFWNTMYCHQCVKQRVVIIPRDQTQHLIVGYGARDREKQRFKTRRLQRTFATSLYFVLYNRLYVLFVYIMPWFCRINKFHQCIFIYFKFIWCSDTIKDGKLRPWSTLTAQSN